jgi:micrococcal nuclease
MHTHYYTRIFACLLGLCLLFGIAGATEAAQISRLTVVDGDTLAITTKQGKVRHRELIRLIGIDAPELGQHPWGQRSQRHLRKILKKNGGAVRFEYDVEERDRYGRLLAYAWLADGTLLNERMVRSGYALAYTLPPNVKHATSIADAQKKARQRHAGLWKYDAFREIPHQWRQEHPNP